MCPRLCAWCKEDLANLYIEMFHMCSCSKCKCMCEYFCVYCNYLKLICMCLYTNMPCTWKISKIWFTYVYICIWLYINVSIASLSLAGNLPEMVNMLQFMMVVDQPKRFMMVDGAHQHNQWSPNIWWLMRTAIGYYHYDIVRYYYQRW